MARNAMRQVPRWLTIVGLVVFPGAQQLVAQKHFLTLREHDNWVWSLAFSPNGKKLVSGSCDRTLRLWDIGSQTPKSVLLQLPGREGQVYGVAVSPDGKLIASAFRSGVVKLWDLASGKEMAMLKGHEDSVLSV